MSDQPITDEAVQAFRVAERTAQGFRRSPADRVRAGLAAAYPLLRQLDVEQTADLDQAVELLADLVAKCTDYGSQDGGFVASYLLPTGPVHRAIPWLDQHGITVRPGQPPTRPVRLRRRSPQETLDYLAAKRAELVQAGQSTELLDFVVDRLDGAYGDALVTGNYSSPEPVGILGGCPNEPRCPHAGVLHDIEDQADPRPRCCADGCGCGERPAGLVAAIDSLNDAIANLPALSIRGDLDVTIVIAALDRMESEGPDEASRQAAADLLGRLGAWMGSDGRYRPAGPGGRPPAANP